MPRQHIVEPFERPCLQRLRQQRMVRVGQRPLREIPGLIPSQMRLVEQDTHEFGNGHGRMGVIQLDGDFFRKSIPILIASTKAPNQIAQRTGHQKILLQKSQTLPPGLSSHRGRARA